jgi:hypothetical protein
MDYQSVAAHIVYQSFMYDLLLLLFNEDSVRFLMAYFERTSSQDLDVETIHFGFFNNSSRLASRIREIYEKIDWNDQSQNHAAFFTWLEDVFLPLLNRIRGKIPNIDQLVDDYLRERCPGKTLAIILAELRQHCRSTQNGASGASSASGPPAA